MTSPLVSVIVPTFNRAYCLPGTLDSVLAQRHDHLEILVIDDGSSDGTEGLVARSYGHDNRVRYFRQENRGVAIARNVGLKQSRGAFIALLDSDDIWMPWKLELQLACFERCPEIGMIWTNMQAIGPGGNLVSNAYLRTMYHAFRWFRMAELFPTSYELPAAVLPPESAGARLHVGDIFSQMVMGSLVHTSTVILRRERLEKVGLFKDIRPLGEDYDFHLRTCREGPVGFVDVAAIQYRTGVPGQLTSTCNRVPTALNCLKTVTEVLRQDGRRIRLSRSMIRKRLAGIHLWAGDALLECGETARARKHLLRSLWHRPFQFRSLALLARATLPAGVGAFLQRFWRGLKQAVSARTASAHAAKLN